MPESQFNRNNSIKAKEDTSLKNLNSSSRNKKAGGKKFKAIAVKDKRLKEIKALGKVYMEDYNDFTYKIDSILNEGYSFIKKAKSPVIPPSRIKIEDIKSISKKLF